MDGMFIIGMEAAGHGLAAEQAKIIQLYKVDFSRRLYSEGDMPITFVKIRVK